MTDIFAAERQMIFAEKVDELALLLAGEYGENARLALGVVREELEDELGEEVLELFLQGVLMKKIRIEQSTAQFTPLRLQ